jgi:hypothetical protein
VGSRQQPRGTKALGGLGVVVPSLDAALRGEDAI